MGPEANGYACTSTVTKPTVVFDPDVGSAISVTPPFIVTQINIVVTWASSDLDSLNPKLAPILGPAGISASQTSSPSQQTSPSSPSTSPPPDKSGSSSGSGLSTGDKTGIGVSVAVGGVVVLALLYYFCYKRIALAEVIGVLEPAQPLDRSEVAANQVYEARAQLRRTELHPNATRAELDGSWRRYEAHQSST